MGKNYFSVEKMHDFDVFNECVTNQQTNRPTNGHSLLQRCEDASKKREKDRMADLMTAFILPVMEEKKGKSNRSVNGEWRSPSFVME